MAVKSTITNKTNIKAAPKAVAPVREAREAKKEDKVMPFGRQSETQKGEVTSLAPKPKKNCYFCETKTDPSYTDSVALRKFMSDRAKIVSRLRTGACSKHQRKITREIKHARHLALLPFVARV